MTRIPRFNQHCDPGVLRLAFVTPLLVASLLLTPPAMASQVNWSPQSSERLVKLPTNYLKKSLDNDFAQSSLGEALSTSEENISLKGSTLADLQQAIASSTGDVRLELRHEFLAEKRAYLDMMTERNALRRQHLETKRNLFEDMLDHLSQQENTGPGAEEVIANQEAALERFERTYADVDRNFFSNSMAPESRYAQQFTKNMQAIEQLVARIENHKLNASSMGEEEIPMTRKEHLRRLVSDAQAEISIIEQEETILGYMAKLVALDAMDLADDGLDAELADSDVTRSLQPATSVSYFLNN
ncbi:MAG: hypothetical protein OQK24_02845 [Magnetovibrio sp.]|nr:hypothetical protein [Magnetovibrio sp.]